MNAASSQLMPFLLNLVAAIVGALGQYSYKVGASRLGSEPIYRNWPLFLGMALFCAVMGLFVAGFKMGGKLSVVYPAYATTFIWAAMIARVFAKEEINLLQTAGILVIVLGVSLVAVAGSR